MSALRKVRHEHDHSAHPSEGCPLTIRRIYHQAAVTWQDAGRKGLPEWGGPVRRADIDTCPVGNDTTGELGLYDAHRSLTCVFADDAPAVRDVMRMHFDLLGWVNVLGEASDGADALDLIVRLRPDIAVLDMRMPRLSGFAVAAQLRALEVPVQVVIFSAFSSEENDDRARQLGAHYVSKVDGSRALNATLQRLRALAILEGPRHAA